MTAESRGFLGYEMNRRIGSSRREERIMGLLVKLHLSQ